MHASDDPRLARSYDALQVSFSILEHTHTELHASCLQLAERSNLLPVALGKAWLCVDTVHRIRELAQGVRGLSSQRTEVVEMLAATNVAEDFRHYMQHLRREVLRIPQNNFPVWGTLSWLDPNKPQLVHMAMAGASRKGLPHTGPSFDLVSSGYASKVTLTVGSLAFDFDPIVEEVQKFAAFILPWLRETSKATNIVNDSPVIASMEFLGITKN